MEKQQIFEKWQNFENRPAFKGYRACKGHRLCKNGQIGSKIKNAKNMRKTIQQEHYSCFVQKPLEKAPNIREMRRF